MIKAVLFDVGNTLISYYTSKEFPDVLQSSINNCLNYLKTKGEISNNIWEKVWKHNHGSPGNKVYPLEERLADIFTVHEVDELNKLCDLFMKPIFNKSKIYDDVVPTIRELKQRGLKVGIISNTPWGCPSRLWECELKRYGLTEYLDSYVFCVDVGWRKPDRRIFIHALSRLGEKAENCLFVGDDPRWDKIGPESIGMKSILIDRHGENVNAIHQLDEILELLA